MSDKQEPTTPMTIRDIPVSLRLQVRAKAMTEGKNFQEIIIELMREYVKQKK